jgi:hypothetical protein
MDSSAGWPRGGIQFVFSTKSFPRHFAKQWPIQVKPSARDSQGLSGVLRCFGKTSDDKNATHGGNVLGVLGVLGVPFYRAGSRGAAWLLRAFLPRCATPVPKHAACVQLKGEGSRPRVSGLGPGSGFTF